MEVTTKEEGVKETNVPVRKKADTRLSFKRAMQLGVETKMVVASSS